MVPRISTLWKNFQYFLSILVTYKISGIVLLHEELVVKKKLNSLRKNTFLVVY